MPVCFAHTQCCRCTIQMDLFSTIFFLFQNDSQSKAYQKKKKGREIKRDICFKCDYESEKKIIKDLFMRLRTHTHKYVIKFKNNAVKIKALFFFIVK